MPRHPRFDKDEALVKYILWRGRIDREFRKTKEYKYVLYYRIFQWSAGLLTLGILVAVVYFGTRGR